MSTDAYVTVKRGGTAVASIPAFSVQIDNMSQQEASYYGGDAPYMRYAIYARMLYDVRQEDLLVDTVNIDPKTGAKKQYRVINDPEAFPDLHMEIVADRVRGI